MIDVRLILKVFKSIYEAVFLIIYLNMFCTYNLYIENIILSLLTFIMFLNITLFYLDDFLLSNNKLIKFLQILTPIWLVIFIVVLFNTDIFTVNNNIVLFIDDNNKNISNSLNIGGSIEVTRDAAEVLGRNIGVAGTIAGVSGAVAKAISKSSMPPIQKAGIVLGSAGLAGGIHIGTSVINKIVNASIPNYDEGKNPLITSNTISSDTKIEGVNKFIGEGFNNLSELKLLLLSMNTIIGISLSLIIILFSMILFKFYLKEENIKLNYLIGNKLNNLLIKLIKFNKKTSNIYIFIIFILLFIALGFECYFITELYNHLDKFIYFHQNR
uniref:Uncharacterized protein n=1 Tax=Tolypocladium guangdongense TaxID=2730933 RepID=A0A7S8WWL0_9HYPO|nr:hypothetical protein J6816_mgp07 [Tolypocladium guangdongense]QPF24429.1 hypothetical protein [Tolypocladium guangdongense]